MTGIRLWAPVEWDSEFFGFPVARLADGPVTGLSARRALAECREAGVHVLTYLAAAGDDGSVRVVEGCGFHLLDIRLTLEWRVADAVGLAPPSGDVRPFRPGDEADLAAIARTSFQETRYFLDGSFPRERCEMLYETWVRRSAAGWAERVFVAERDGRAAGFVSCHLPTGAEGSIGIMAVREGLRGAGLGAALMSAARAWFAEAGARCVTVVTQGRTVPAQRLYQRSSFVTRRAELWYHAHPTAS
jgi:dTDP-4-amino-4,6-dideoxy-D-galactose acyltransferase